jgi:probable rRNA maturation factor
VVKNLHVNYSVSFIFDKGIIHKIVSCLQRELNFSINAVTVNFVSSREIIDLNIKYLNHHNSTDIITFNYSGNHTKLDGEIFISLDDCRNNADRFRVKFNEEVGRLIIHGFLHLLGYNDKFKSEKKKMFILQENLLNNCKFALQK